MTMWKEVGHWKVFSFLGSLLIACVVLWPIVHHPASRIADDSDGLLGAWAIYTVQENILHGKPLLTGNIFYPHKNTVLFSDVFISSALLTLPVRFFTQEPLVPYSVAIFVALAGTIFFASLFFSQLLKLVGRENNLLAFTASCIFSLSQIHMHYIGHLHMFSLQFVIASMWAMLVFLEKKKDRWLYIASLFCVLQVWQSFFLVYYVVFFVLFLLFVPSVRKILLQRKKTVFLAFLLFLFGSLPLVFQFVQFFHTYHVVRDIREAIHFSLLFSDVWGHFFSPVAYGFLFLSLFVFLRNRFHHPLMRALFVLGLFLFVMSLGPALHISADTTKISLFGHQFHIPLPYTFFYYLAPGFQAFRTPSRFMPATLFFLMAAGMIVMSKPKGLRIYGPAFTVLCIGISIFVVVPVFAFHVPKTTLYPSYVFFLQSRPEHVLLSLPMRDWADPLAKEDVYQMLYSLKYGKQLVNGQSGFFPDEWLSFQHEVLMTFPSVHATDIIRKRGIELLLIHKKFYPMLQAKKLASYGLNLEYEDGEVFVASLTPTLVQ